MKFMKRATMTLPSDLAKAVDEYVRAQEAPPALTAVVQAALREFLRERGFLREYRPLKIAAKGKSANSDVSQNHDLYLTGLKK
jgi:metal-responsive CopG/Arc/MetJ family transcriptional regulator